jgi:hypothetical protein
LRCFPLGRPSQGLQVEKDHARHRHDAEDTKENLLRSFTPLANSHGKKRRDSLAGSGATPHLVLRQFVVMQRVPEMAF